MRILGLIPARAGSKGVPGKNIRPLAGKPLLEYTARPALESSALDRVCLSTDSEEIADVGRRLLLEVPFIRPAHLAQDDSPTIDTVIHALEYYRTIQIDFDAVCLLQPTSPFREPGFIDRAIAKFISSGADSLISVRQVPHEFNPHWVFEPTADGFLQIATGDEKIIPRRQDLPPAYHRDGSIYISKTETVFASRTLLGNSVAYIASKGLHVNIDTPEDWERAAQFAANF